MDVLSQALSVAAEAEAAGGPVTLTFDLRDASHRAAYAAALAVLRISGVDEDDLIAQRKVVALGASGDDGASTVLPVTRRNGEVAKGEAKGEQNTEPAPDTDEAEVAAPPEPEHYTGFTAELRQRYQEAMTDLTPDEARRGTAARETFPRVADLLLDGANVEAVAQIQYRRWVEENLDAVR
jgi:hypothetical protein